MATACRGIVNRIRQAIGRWHTGQLMIFWVMLVLLQGMLVAKYANFDTEFRQTESAWEAASRSHWDLVDSGFYLDKPELQEKDELRLLINSTTDIQRARETRDSGRQATASIMGLLFLFGLLVSWQWFGARADGESTRLAGNRS